MKDCHRGYNTAMDNRTFCPKILDILYVSIICFFVILTVYLISCIKQCVNLSVLADVVTAIITLFAFVWATKEYDLHKETLKAKVLSEYNKRYTEDPNIVRVVRYLQNYRDSNSYQCYKLTKQEIQMFMRFFEELKVQINHGRIDEEDVFELFTYYASYLNEKREIIDSLGIKYNNVYWSNYISLVVNYDEYIKNKKEKNKSINNDKK
jgi:hypothetical protein